MSRPRAFSEKVEVEIFLKWKEGVPVSTLSKDYGKAVQTMYNIISRQKMAQLKEIEANGAV